MCMEHVNNTTSKSASGWLFNSACTSHMTSDPNMIRLKKTYTSTFQGHFTRKDVTCGEGDLEIYFQPTDQDVTLKNCLYVPSIARNLLSVPALVDKGAMVQFSKRGCFVSLNNKKILTGSRLENGFFKLDGCSATDFTSNNVEILKSVNAITEKEDRDKGNHTNRNLSL